MTPLALVALAGTGTLCLLLVLLSTVYLRSSDAALRVRAWHVLQALLYAAGRERNDATGPADDARGEARAAPSLPAGRRPHPLPGPSAPRPHTPQHPRRIRPLLQRPQRE